MESRKQIRELAIEDATLWTFAVGPSRIACDTGEALGIWDLEGRRLGSMKGHKAGILSLRISSDAKFLVSGSSDGSLRLWDMEKMRALRVLE
jgi:WD40 repeat protein